MSRVEERHDKHTKMRNAKRQALNTERATVEQRRAIQQKRKKTKQTIARKREFGTRQYEEQEPSKKIKSDKN